MHSDKQSIQVSPKGGGLLLPALVVDSGSQAGKRFAEFFAARIRNANTRRAYATAVNQFFNWCDARGIALDQIGPIAVAAYIEQHPGSKPTVKQHLAAIRMVFDWLTTGGIITFNPAASVRGPKYSTKRGKTPVLRAAEARKLLDSIDVGSPIGLRDRALIGLMAFSFARVGAAIGMLVEDYYREGGQAWFRLHEKGGKLHYVPAHPKAASYLDDYIAKVSIAEDMKGPLFRTLGRNRMLSSKSMATIDALKMVKRRAKASGLPENTCCHTFRATGITAYLENGGTIEGAQAIANHANPQTTKLYDRRQDKIAVEEVNRILI
jgi:integrase/recombinase XerD